MLTLMTDRLELIAATPALARAAADGDHERFGRDLNATVPQGWPQKDLGEVQPFVADELEQDPERTGWLMWYVILTEGDRTLIGAAGLNAPDDRGYCETGYGILDPWQRRGFATESMRALIDWGFRHERARAVFATTFERHPPSLRVLEKLGYHCVGVSSNDHEVPESDRQGRGRLLRWERSRIPTHEVIIADYDDTWPARFEHERTLVRTAIDTPIEVAHIGSTAVPGLASKPVIDLLVATTTQDDAQRLAETLDASEHEDRIYAYMAHYDSVMPERRLAAARATNGRLLANIHIVWHSAAGDAFRERHLRFRDALRTNDTERDAYADLKRRLANEHREDRFAYTDAKSGFIESVVSRASR